MSDLGVQMDIALHRDCLDLIEMELDYIGANSVESPFLANSTFKSVAGPRVISFQFTHARPRHVFVLSPSGDSSPWPLKILNECDEWI